MNGFRGDDDLRLVNDRIHAMHVDAARQRLVRQPIASTTSGAPDRSLPAAVLAWPRRILHARPTPVVGR